MTDIDISEALCRVCRLFGERQWCLATSGNFSARQGSDRMLITESGKDKSRLVADDLMLCDLQGNAMDVARQPSAETPLHALLYELDKDIGAVMHTHSVASTVVSRAAGDGIRICGFEMQKAFADIESHVDSIEVPVFDNDQDMQALAAVVRRAWQDGRFMVPGFVIRGHGLYAWGVDVAAAHRHVEGFEFLFECLRHEASAKVRAVLTDIEGTTSSISFVHDILFPYAQKHLPDFVATMAHDSEVSALLDDVRAEAGEKEADVDRVVAILLGWIAEDRKATPLKALQGMIWRHGYEAGDFTGHVYADAVKELKSWDAAGKELYVYSSGSVGAQQLLFGHSDAGDLKPLFSGYFDTRMGHKREANSYREIAKAIGLPARQILFLSDIVEELDAASSAGMKTTQLVRNSDVITRGHTIAHDFTEVVLD